MSFSFSKRAGIVLLAGFFSFPMYADPDPQASSSFETVCTDAWMKKGDDAKDPLDYKNFGEKYCGCAAMQPLDNDAAIQSAIHLCMSQTLLHDAMDSLEDEVGLSKATDSDITDYCQDRWNLIYPKLSDEDKKLTVAYCECAKPQLMALIKQSENMTDKQYSEGIDKVAAACSSNAVASKPAAN